jgi:YD repeat-containing protein
MSEYDAWAPVYDAWASDMTEDVAHYVSLAREADGPIVELMVGSVRQDRSGVVHTLHYIPADNRIEIVRDDGATVRLWWAAKSEWDGLLDVAGLEVEALYGGFGREPFTDESLEIVYVARRP